MSTAAAVRVRVVRFSLNGHLYLRSPFNVLYDANTREEVGTWDPVNRVIIPFEDEEDDYVDDLEDQETDTEDMS